MDNWVEVNGILRLVPDNSPDEWEELEAECEPTSESLNEPQRDELR